MSEATESTPADVTAEAAAQTSEPKTRTPGPGKVARTYFEAVAARDLDGMVA